MTPWFSTPARIAALRTMAEQLVGTPFAPAGFVPGPRGGACCHRLVIGATASTGFAWRQDDVPDAPLNRAAHHAGSLMADWLRAHPDRFAEIALSERTIAAPGDILLFRLGIGAHHAGVLLDRREVLQTWQQLGATIVPFDDPRLAKRLWAVFRPLSHE